LLISYKNKLKDTLSFNKDIIENNTSELKKNLAELKQLMVKIDNKVSSSEGTHKIEIIKSITEQDKTKMYRLLKIIVDKFDKCNYIVEAKVKLPFPYTDIIMNGFMILIIIVCIFYVTSQFAPWKRLKTIKELYKIKHNAKTSENLDDFKVIVEYMSQCHQSEIVGLVLTLKMVVFFFIVMLLLFYAIRMMQSSAEFKWGLYNSTNYEDSKCYGE